jgi:hypothetical protein
MVRRLERDALTSDLDLIIEGRAVGDFPGQLGLTSSRAVPPLRFPLSVEKPLQ